MEELITNRYDSLRLVTTRSDSFPLVTTRDHSSLLVTVCRRVIVLGSARSVPAVPISKSVARCRRRSSPRSSPLVAECLSLVPLV